jgi:hypothetical protein
MIGAACQARAPLSGAPPSAIDGSRTSTSPQGEPRLQPKGALLTKPNLGKLAKELASEADSEVEAALLLSSWIYSSLSASGADRSAEAGCGGRAICLDEVTLTLLDGACGQRASLMIDVLGAMGIPAKRVQFFNIPAQVSHVAVAVLAGGEEYFFDPTFGVFFADPEAPDLPLSIDEARRRPPEVWIRRIDAPGWTGSWASLSALADKIEADGMVDVPRGPLIHPRQPGTAIADVDLTYFLSTMHVEGRPGPFTQRITIDTQRQPKGSLGRVDASYRDLLDHAPKLSYGTTYTPFLYVIGTYAAGVGPNVEDEFRLLTTTKKRFELSLIFTEPVGEESRERLLGRLRHTALNTNIDNYLLEYTWGPDRLTLSFLIMPPMSMLLLTLGPEFGEENNLHLDAIQWTSRSP